MLFYHILWLIIYITGGILIGIYGLADIHYFTILIINPRVVNALIFNIEQKYISLDIGHSIPALVRSTTT